MYSFYVIASYAAVIGLVAGLVWVSFRARAKARAQLRQAEKHRS